jgi:hypothetical protein
MMTSWFDRNLFSCISPFAFSPSVGEVEESSHFSLSLSTFVAKHQFIQEAVLTIPFNFIVDPLLDGLYFMDMLEEYIWASCYR